MNQFKQSSAALLEWKGGYQGLSSLNKREMEKHTQYQKSSIVEHFDSIAPNYDSIMKIVGYPDPQKIAD